MQKITTRSLVLLAVVLLALQTFAQYTVVLKDGTRYKAKAKWTVVNGKALINLTTGQTLQVDPALIDVAKSEQITRLGVNANIVDLNTNAPVTSPAASRQQPSLGDTIRLRPRNGVTAAQPAAATPAPATAPAIATVAGSLPGRVIDNFDKAYENVGIFEKKINSTGARSLRAELTVDTEERVFMAISATSFLMVKNAGVDGAQIDMVELFMKTTTGGSAGRFQMSRADADALEQRAMTQQDYFIRKVIY
jgi:hypothetical protein